MGDSSADTRERVFEYIVDYKQDHDGLAPSITEIARKLYLSRTTARYHVMMLEHEGRIRVLGRRAIQVIGGAWALPGEDGSPELEDNEDTADPHGASR